MTQRPWMTHASFLNAFSVIPLTVATASDVEMVRIKWLWSLWWFFRQVIMFNLTQTTLDLCFTWLKVYESAQASISSSFSLYFLFHRFHESVTEFYDHLHGHGSTAPATTALGTTTTTATAGNASGTHGRRGGGGGIRRGDELDGLGRRSQVAGFDGRHDGSLQHSQLRGVQRTGGVSGLRSAALPRPETSAARRLRHARELHARIPSRGH